MSGSKKYLFWLVFLYCLVRIPIILSIQEPFSEDLFRGTIAAELLGRFDLPIWDYVPQPYGYGALLAGIWTVPFFALFGKTLFALKLAPFCWHLLSLVAWFFVFRAHFFGRTTFFILLFFVLSPPLVTEYSLYNNGYHFEMILWMALSILIFRSFLNKKIKVLPAALGLGFLGGFSSSLILTNVVTVITIWIYLIFQKNIVQKKFFYLLYSTGFLIGFAPWIFLQFSTQWRGLEHVVYWLSPEAPFFHFAKNLFGIFLKSGGGFQGLFGFSELPLLPGKTLTMIILGLYSISLFLLLKRKWPICRNVKGFDVETFGLLFQILFILFVAANRFGVDLNYFLFPMILFVGMTMVTAFENLKVQRAVVLVFVMVGVIGNTSLLHVGNMGKPLKLKGYSHAVWSGYLGYKFCPDFPLFKDKFKKVTEGRSLAEKKVFYQVFDAYCFQLKEAGDLQNFISFINGVEEEFQPILFQKLGMQLGEKFEHDKIDSLLRQSNIKEKFYTDIYRGVVEGPPEWGCKANPICYENLEIQ